MNLDSQERKLDLDLIDKPTYEDIDIEKEYFKMVVKRVALKKSIKNHIIYTLIISLVSSIAIFYTIFNSGFMFNVVDINKFEFSVVFTAIIFILINFFSMVYKLIKTPLETLKKPRKEVAEFNVRLNMFKCELKKESISDERIMQIFNYCNSVLTDKVKY